MTDVSSHEEAGEPRVTRTTSVRTIALGLGAVLMVLIGVLFVASRGDSDGDGSTSPLIGKAAPALAGLDANGDEVSLDEFRGRWVVVNFFATWCAPCVREHPELVEFNERAVERGDTVVVSVAYLEKPEVISEFFDRHGGDWPVIVEGADTPTLEFGVRALPESFLIDPDGVVVDKLVGGVTVGELEESLEQAKVGRAA